jgi:hypothetical protein
MKFLSWLIGDENKEAEEVRKQTAELAANLKAINERLRASAGLAEVPKVKLIGGRK